MSKYIPGNQKHLTLDDRKYIENALNKGTTFKDIARFLCKDPTTISKEVKAHRLSDWYHKGTFYNKKNFCIHRYHCKKTNACGKIILCGVKCASCPTCNQTCPDFEKERCSRLDKAPYVCNGCPKQINHCTIAHKYSYNAKSADRKYREKLRDSRSGISLSKHELHQKDMVISPLIEQGQSPYQIVTNHPELDMSVRTVYTYLNQGLFTARDIDLKRKVKFKPRKCHKTQITDRSVFNGRTYSDFQALELLRFSEMDTVHSSRESKKTLLTFFFPQEKLFLAFLMNRCTKGAVRLVFDRLEKRMGTFKFASVFEYILTDRGSEFGDPESLETGVNGIQRTSIYYCIFPPLVFLIAEIGPHTRNGKILPAAVQRRQPVVLAGDKPAGFIKDGLHGKFVMLKEQVLFGGSVVGVFRVDMFECCQPRHLLSLRLHT